jgi:hypothetical protein
VKRAAIDSTGLECSAASGYFIRRRSRVESPWKTVVYHHYPKLGVVSGIDDHFIYAYQAGRGPRPDVDEFRPLVADALQRVRISQMAADAGYDSEPNHKFARDQHGIRTVIPPKHGRPTTKPATGRYRRLMQVRFDRPTYRQRAQIETLMSMIKRRQGGHVGGRSFWSQCRDLRLLALTHNVLLLVLGWVFYRAPTAHLRGATCVIRRACRASVGKVSSYTGRHSDTAALCTLFINIWSLRKCVAELAKREVTEFEVIRRSDPWDSLAVRNSILLKNYSSMN